MKKLIILIFILLISINILGSENNILISNKIIEMDGWKLNTNIGMVGQWIRNRNVIYKDYIDSSYERSFIEQNFNFIKILKLNFESENYYIFIYEKWSGEYLQKSWRQELQKHYFIMNEEQYLYLKNSVKNQSGEIIIIETYKYGHIKDKSHSISFYEGYSFEYLLENIKKVIKIPNYHSNLCFKCGHYKKSLVLTSNINRNNEPIVRFRLPEMGGEFLNVEKIYTEYFEIPFNEFIVLFDLN